MYPQSDGQINGPLTLEEVQRIDETNFSSIDKHSLRLLAHCLACFKIIANRSNRGPVPSESSCKAWLDNQSFCKDDEGFRNALLEQFASAGKQLEFLANHFRISPLELTIDHLILFIESRR